MWNCKRVIKKTRSKNEISSGNQSGTALQKKHIILFFQLKHLQKTLLFKNFLSFHRDVILDKLSKLDQVSSVIRHYSEIKDTSHLGKFLVNLLENWYKMKKIIA